MNFVRISWVLAALTVGCAPSEEELLCEDYADAWAGSAAACGFDYQANYDAVVALAAGGDCGNITGIRDIDAFENECIPWVDDLTCEQVDDPDLELHDACVGQLSQ